MISQDKNEDLILKIYTTENDTKIALLKCDYTCRLYVELINAENPEIEKIKLKSIYFSDSDAKQLAPQNEYDAEYDKYFSSLKDGIEREFYVVHKIHSFFIDFSRNLICFECLNKGWTLINGKPNYHDVSYVNTFRVLNFQGDVLLETKTNKNYISDEGHNFQLFKNNIISYDGEHDEVFLNIWDLNNDRHEQKLSTEENLGGEYFFEYFRYFSINKEKNMWGLLAENPTYGIDGLRIFDISDIKNAKLVYSRDIENVLLGHFSLSSNGESIVYLEYDNIADLDPDGFINFKVYIDKLEPPKNVSLIIVKTDYDYSKNYPHVLDIRFFNEETICITLHDKFIFCDISTKKEKYILNRNKNSPYFFSNQFLYYIDKFEFKKQPAY